MFPDFFLLLIFFIKKLRVLTISFGRTLDTANPAVLSHWSFIKI